MKTYQQDYTAYQTYALLDFNISFEFLLNSFEKDIPAASAVPLDIKNKIISLYINDFSDANFIHFCEIVESDFGIKISDTTLNSWMRAENVLSPKARKNQRKP